MMQRTTRVSFLILASLFAANSFASPYELSYGGRLTESSGKPVSSPVTLRISFFRSPTGSDQVVVALPDYAGVTLQDGIFQISIALSSADFHTVFTSTDQTYIQVEDLTHGIAYPRQKFSAVPYALKVPVDGQSITFNANGELALGNGANTLKLPNAAGAVNKVLKSDGAGALIWADDLSGGGAGTITSTEIQDGAITNDDISNTAAISTSKISGLGGLATKSAVGSSDITDGSVTSSDIADGTITDADINATANISYLKISGLGSAASKNVGTAAGEVAAGNHAHTSGDVSGLGALATKSAVGSSDITDSSIADADISATAAISGSKINPDFGSQNVSTTGNATAATLQANTNFKLKSDNTNTVTMQAPSGLAAGYALTLPADDGTSGQVLTTDGSGTLTWNTASNGDMFKANNLSDLTDTSAARTNLGLGSLATKSAVGSSDITDGSVTSSDIAAGTITDANISSSAAISSAKISGLGGLATKSAVGSSDITDGSVTGSDIADGTITDADINATAAIVYTKISGLGTAATKAVGTGASDVAAGNHSHTDATTGAPGFMSASDKVRLNAAIVTTDTGTVTGTMIANETVTGGNIVNGSVALADLSQTMCGADQILKMNGTGTALTCAAAAGGISFATQGASYTITASDADKVIVFTAGATATLPSASTVGAGFKVTIKLTSSSGYLFVETNGIDLLDGTTMPFVMHDKQGIMTVASNGTDWYVIANTRGSKMVACGGAGDSCYNDAEATTEKFAYTPNGKRLEYVATTQGFLIWKEVGGNRILQADGLDGWQKKLNINGKDFTATDATTYDQIAGRVCPTNVYVSDSNKFATSRCLYHTALLAAQTLNAAGTSQVTNGSIGLGTWSTQRWYAGNIQTCTNYGMRLPTIFETNTSTTSSSYYPTGDGSPVFAQSTGIPVGPHTATTSSYGSSSYWGNGTYGGSYSSSYNIRCVSP